MRLVVGTLLALAFCAAFASSAFAGPSLFSWSGESPTPGVPLHQKAGPVSVNIVSANALDPSSGQITIDGVAYTTIRTPGPSVIGTWHYTDVWDDDAEEWVGTWVWIPSPDLTHMNLFTYAYNGPLGKDGTHTVLATIKDSTGVASSDSWQFGVHIKPVLGDPTPASGSTLDTLTPTITAPVSDNNGVTSCDVRVNGVPATATIDGGTTLRITPTGLTNDTNIAVTATIYDADGNSAAASWTYRVQIYPDMLDTSGECITCHPGYENDPDMTPICKDCHGPSNPPHAGLPMHIHVTADVSACGGCHVSDITVEHARHLDGAGNPLSCSTCHLSTNPTVVAAIAAGDTSCVRCHGTVSHYDSVDHTATPAPQVISISGVSFGSHACTECHSMRLGDIHSASGSPDCAKCHPSPRSSFTNWNFGCVQGGCHTPASTAPMHAAIDSVHAFPAARSDCLASGCHDATAMTPFQGKSIAEIHSVATTTTPGGQTRTSCQICHAAGVTPASDCLTAGCHPDRASAHGYVAAIHTSSESCLLSCHSNELAPAHAAQVTPTTVTCSGCHPVLASSVKPWNGQCSACHAVIAHSSANHVGSDATARVSRSNTGGCSDTSPGQIDCHDISNISTIHYNLPSHGCLLCHGVGKTPTNDCRTCHVQNDRPTTVSAVATFFPAVDGALVGTAVNSTGTTRYNLVSEYPSDNDATYFQFTSPGSAMFTGSRSIPASATIQSVTINVRGRTGSATTKTLFGMAVIGGQTFQGTTSNPAGSYITPGYYMTSNPKSGKAWRPDELNSAGGTSTLDFFGAGTSSATSTPTGYMRVTSIWVTVSYTVPATYPAGTITYGGTWYHHNNNKYLISQSDAVPGTFFYPDAYPPNGWYDGLYYQDCYDSCHAGILGAAWDFAAPQGSWMWYSVGGDPYGSPLERILTLRSVTLPASSPRLAFQTDYELENGATGVVEISTNGGSTWTALTGTVGGVPTSTLSGDATGWTSASYDLSAYAGQTVKLRFRYENSNNLAGGWAFDTLTISGSSGTVFSDDAETLKPDWDNSFWTRAHHAFPYQ